MTSEQPVLISVMQFEDELAAGTRTVYDVIETAHRLGVDGVELRRETWPQMADEQQSARQRIEELGLLVTFATHATLFSADAAGRQLLRQDIDTARALGSPQLRVFQGPAPADDDEQGWAAGRAAVAYAASQGIVLALENYARTPGGRLAEIQRVLDHIQDPALATNIDIGNYYLHEEDIPAAIRAVGSRAVSAHLKDQTGTPGDPPTYLGNGVMALDEILAELDRLSQSLLYCFEFRGGGEPEARIQRSLTYLRERQ